MKKILVSDILNDEGIKILKEAKEIEVEIKPGLSEEELINIISKYSGLIVRSTTKVTRKIITAGVNLKVIGRAGVGLDNIDTQAAREKGIVIINVPGGNTITTAEHTLALILSLTKNIPQAYISLRNKKWEKKKFKGMELYKKILGIVGLGKIGASVAKYALGFEMEVIAYDPFVSFEYTQNLKVELVEFRELLKISDIITIHTPFNENTKYLIGKDEFEVMKNGVRIINCARGGIINEEALYEAIKSGKVKGAALDVFEKEPPFDSPLLELDEVIFTPHIGAATSEAQIRNATEIAHKIIEFFKLK